MEAITLQEAKIISECLKIVAALSLQTEFLNDKHASIRDFDPQTMPYQLVIRSRNAFNNAATLNTSLMDLSSKLSEGAPIVIPTPTPAEPVEAVKPLTPKPVAEIPNQTAISVGTPTERKVATGQLNDNGFTLRTGSLNIQVGPKNVVLSADLQFNKNLNDGQKLVLLNAFENSISQLNQMPL